MIEFLVNELIEQGGECLIQTEDADQMVGFSFYLTIKNLSFIAGKSQRDQRGVQHSPEQVHGSGEQASRRNALDEAWG